MAHKKSLLAGIALGAGAAWGIREAVTRLRNRSRVEGYQGLDAMLEPEDSRTESYVPNSVMEVGRDSSWICGGTDNLRHASKKASKRAKTGGAELLRRKVNAIGAREDRKEERERAETSEAEANVLRDQRATGRTSTNTESELRRTGTDKNPVRYTRPSEPPTTSGSEAPFIKEGI